jgi:hypothetical protein
MEWTLTHDGDACDLGAFDMRVVRKEAQRKVKERGRRPKYAWGLVSMPTDVRNTRIAMGILIENQEWRYGRRQETYLYFRIESQRCLKARRMSLLKAVKCWVPLGSLLRRMEHDLVMGKVTKKTFSSLTDEVASVILLKHNVSIGKFLSQFNLQF